ncbi:glucosidase [Mycobacterium sp. KBS0706]|uniref:MGH1-like glycoside hydrolase domain-containing protein n=1 Tax=Mycobacterium sp. KBS0706 TaxID=2578109 RepID=UPI00110FE67B|nr:glucosidase [Mycobacterium sp. KBS0706]TSD84651.1 glucosidase [Mycobacterium sp. KBS0706]
MTKKESEAQRLIDARERNVPWRRWGPYLSERQWGTVREDYSEDGNAWNYFSHDQARSRAYRWGEDGLAGICDDHQLLCFALALWNGKDPILKERLFGLTNSEGNHGEDVKEYYFYLDSTPTHSYMKYLYKYPQFPYPYSDIVDKNRQRGRDQTEYELMDSGVFNNGRYFDVFVEYAKSSPEDLLIKVTVCNRGEEAASLHLLPTLWFRNTWSWTSGRSKPVLRSLEGPGDSVIHAHHTDPMFRGVLDDHYLYCDGRVALLFTENETNNKRVFGSANSGLYVKDGINECIVHGRREAVNPAGTGTKASALYEMSIGAGATGTVRLRLTTQPPERLGRPFEEFDAVMSARLRQADDFYGAITPSSVKADQDRANVMRQALAGMLWTKQYYYFDVDRWLDEHHAHPLDPTSRPWRNRDWFHMVNDHIISMPDKWEYPWYAAWDLAFHTIALSVVDPDFAKQQLDLMLTGHYLHPNGQIPAYEWNFSDVNPPVHAWATLFQMRTEQAERGEFDLEFAKSAFNKLLLNFTWWVNRKDRFGRNLFEGGFLGLDNIGVFDRSSPLPTGGYLEQADGTAWMALFCQNMMEIAVELAGHDRTYEEMFAKFAEHFLWIAAAMNRAGSDGMWDEEDGFYYDVLRRPDGSTTRLKVRSLVGLLPLCATSVAEAWQRERIPRAVAMFHARLLQMPEVQQCIHPTGPGHLGVAERGIIALLGPERLRRVLGRMLDESEFLSPYGIRSISKIHEHSPYIFPAGGQDYRVDYLPGESNSGMFGGNSNWRGPVWMPINALIIRALLNFYLYYGNDFKVECPSGSGRQMTLFEVAREIAERLTRIFLRDATGRRPVYGTTEKFHSDPHWRDCILFYEYFHGDNGMGLGASHQTGWTGVVAKLIQMFGALDPGQMLECGKRAGFQAVDSGSGSSSS